jgi:hypothetical protein
VDGLILIFWIAACAVAKPTCAQFENACATWMSTAIDQAKYWSNLEIGCDIYGCTCFTSTSSSNSVKRGFTSPAANEAKAGVKIVDKLSESQGVGAALV